jgi:hypothetical protein
MRQHGLPGARGLHRLTPARPHQIEMSLLARNRLGSLCADVRSSGKSRHAR